MWSPHYTSLSRTALKQCTCTHPACGRCISAAYGNTFVDNIVNAQFCISAKVAESKPGEKCSLGLRNTYTMSSQAEVSSFDTSRTVCNKKYTDPKSHQPQGQ